MRREHVIVGGDAALISCKCVPPISTASVEPLPVILGTGDALYLPMGWGFAVTKFRSLSLKGDGGEDEAEDADDDNKKPQPSGVVAAALSPGEVATAFPTTPFLLRFAYAPFPATGPRARKQLGLRQYVGSDWSNSFAGFYSRPVTEVLSRGAAALAGSTSAAREMQPIRQRPLNT
jgi:hypothetical protein